MATEPTVKQRKWDTRRTAKAERLHAGAAHSDGKVINPAQLNNLLHTLPDTPPPQQWWTKHARS